MFEIFHNKMFKRINVLQIKSFHSKWNRLLYKQENVNIVDVTKTTSKSLGEWVLKQCMGSRVGPALLEDFLLLLLLLGYHCSADGKLRIVVRTVQFWLQTPSRSFCLLSLLQTFWFLKFDFCKCCRGWWLTVMKPQGLNRRENLWPFLSICICVTQTRCRREALRCKPTTLPHASGLWASSNHSQRHWGTLECRVTLQNSWNDSISLLVKE